MLGGTFDPIHAGHLRSAVELREALALDELRFVPCHVPPHRHAPVASAAQRLRMLELAIADEPGLSIDTRELQRDEPSYSINTLIALRAELGAAAQLRARAEFSADTIVPRYLELYRRLWRS